MPYAALPKMIAFFAKHPKEMMASEIRETDFGLNLITCQDL
jgi:hypothetical protein